MSSFHKLPALSVRLRLPLPAGASGKDQLPGPARFKLATVRTMVQTSLTPPATLPAEWPLASDFGLTTVTVLLEWPDASDQDDGHASVHAKLLFGEAVLMMELPRRHSTPL
jgi:hypothetical protein